MKNIHHDFVHHIRSYRSFYFMFFTFLLLIISIVIYIFGDKIYAASQPDLLEQAFQPSIENQSIINLWAGKNAVGNEILREWVGVELSIGAWCDVYWQKIPKNDITSQKNEAWFTWSESVFCESVLWWIYNTNLIQWSITTEAPLIVRIAKFLLRITMVLAVTMVIFNGIMWIIESSKWAEVKDAKKNITLIIVGILIALMSLSIINLISSITISSLG